jgi:hypothetical protein
MARKNISQSTLSTGTKVSIIFIITSGLLSLVVSIIGLVLWVRAL